MRFWGKDKDFFFDGIEIKSSIFNAEKFIYLSGQWKNSNLSNELEGPLSPIVFVVSAAQPEEDLESQVGAELDFDLEGNAFGRPLLGAPLQLEDHLSKDILG